MADRVYKHPVSYAEDGGKGVEVRLADESDGTYTPVFRAFLMVWDGSGWIKARAATNGALLLDRGGPGSDLSISQNFTTACTDTIIQAVASTATVHVTACIVTVHNSTTASPAVSVKAGANTVLAHPGVPAGGGIAATDMDLAADAAGGDITFTCDAPTGGSVTVTVHYFLET